MINVSIIALFARCLLFGHLFVTFVFFRPPATKPKFLTGNKKAAFKAQKIKKSIA